VPNIQPPVAPPAGPAEVVLAKGTRLSRVHSSELAPSRFNPTLADSHWGGGRFDASESDRYGYLYAGSDDECAVCEALLRELPLDPGGGRLLPRRAIEGRVLSRLVVTADVTLVGLCDGKQLGRIGQGDNWLVSCPASEYGFTRRWGHAIRRWAPGAEGLVWPSRRDPSKLAYVLFEDRFSAELEEDTAAPLAVAGGLPLDTGVGERYLLSILARYWVTLAP
jgi:hypothetical protein